jgi:hypothetical protein
LPDLQPTRKDVSAHVAEIIIVSAFLHHGRVGIEAPARSIAVPCQIRVGAAFLDLGPELVFDAREALIEVVRKASFSTTRPDVVAMRVGNEASEIVDAHRRSAFG